MAIGGAGPVLKADMPIDPVLAAGGRNALPSWTRVAGRAAFIALVVGAATSISATGRATLGLVASRTICWSFVPAL